MLPTNPLLNATAPAGPHLPTATLRQYAAGTLAPAAQHRVEAHTLACPRCADILAGLLQTPATTTDQALAQLQQRLRLRVQQAEAGRPAAGRARPSHRWVVPQLAAAATLLFGLVAGGWWTWQQRHPAPAVAVATAPAPGQPARPAAAASPVAPAGAPETLAPGTAFPAATNKPVAAASSGLLARHSASASPPALFRRRAHQVAPATPADTASSPAPTLAGGLAQPTAPVAASAAHTPASRAPAPASASRGDSTALSLNEVAPGAAVKKATVPAAALVRADAMPAARALPPAPVGGYPAWREQLRREATEFKPDEGGALSGSVQLRLTIGPDGKLQQISVLHGLRADYDEEAQRLVCDGPGWVPGVGGGKRTAQSIDVAVPFQ